MQSDKRLHGRGRGRDADAMEVESSGGRGSPYARPGRAHYSSSEAAGDRWQHDMYGAGTSDRRERSRNGADLMSRGSYSGSPDTPSAKLLVQGLHYEVSEDELEGLFARQGHLVKCFIRYDRSGRSTGAATVIYKDVRDAVKARREYDGANAKGQPIKIIFEPLREARAAASAQGGDLLSRLGDGGSLATRLAGEERRQAPANAPRAPVQMRETFKSGPRGSQASGRGRDRNERGKQRPSVGGRRRGPDPTADSLDAELDAFMKKPSSASMAASEHVPSNVEKDVEMQ